MIKRVLRLPEVKRKCGISRSAIYEGMKTGGFPNSIKLGSRMVGWSEQEIDDWIQSRLNERDRGGIHG